VGNLSTAGDAAGALSQVVGPGREVSSTVRMDPEVMRAEAGVVGRVTEAQVAEGVDVPSAATFGQQSCCYSPTSRCTATRLCRR
jgi:hypothetical protein